MAGLPRSLLGNETVDPAAVAIRGVAFLLPAALIGWLADHDRSTRAALAESARNFRFIAEELERHDLNAIPPEALSSAFVSGMCRQIARASSPRSSIGTSSVSVTSTADDLDADSGDPRA